MMKREIEKLSSVHITLSFQYYCSLESLSIISTLCRVNENCIVFQPENLLKRNTNYSMHTSLYEIQRKYVEHDFVVSKPFVYFVMDIHTKVSLIAGVITDPLASPIWI
ncbi:hypothetical protein ACI65C_012548 [Semiaphis heraclei]